MRFRGISIARDAIVDTLNSMGERERGGPPALTGHVTEQMQRHYSTVGLDEKRSAIAGVLRLAPVDGRGGLESGSPSVGGTRGGPRWSHLRS